jgi:thiol-disulfide isomerase/thioredoxin
MKLTSLRYITIALLPMTTLSSAAADYYTNDFNALSSVITLKDGDGSTLSELHYKSLDLTKPWVVGQVGSHGFAALSLSHTGDDTAQDNWLITPAVSVTSAEACVYWQARSLAPDFLESYRVMVSTDGGETFTELFSTSAEQSTWVSRIVSLADYVGKDVRIAFVCNSVNKFILAIDKLRIGVPADIESYAVNHTPHFVGNQSEAAVSATITNVGKSLSSASIVLLSDGGVVDSVELPSGFESGQTVDVDLTLPVSLNEAKDYSVWLKDNVSGDMVASFGDKVICSYFPRKVLVDKATATWCNNCPTGEIILQHLEEQYGDEIISVTTHTGDVMTQGDYFSNLGFTTIPHFLVNRNRETASSSNAYFDTEILSPTIASIALSATGGNDGAITMHCDTRFAEALDNSGDKYRIAYTFTRDYHDADAVGNVQSNSSLTSSAEQYYFMPTYITPDMMYFRNVTVDGTCAFSGLAKSLPSEIAADTDYAYDATIQLPSKIESLDNARLVAYILDTESGYVYNAECLNLASLAGINNVIADKGSDDSLTISNGKAIVNFANPTGSYRLTVYSLDGRVVYSHTGTANGTTTFDLDKLSRGMFILSLEHGANKSTHKISLQ